MDLRKKKKQICTYRDFVGKPERNRIFWSPGLKRG
jgi:hypothetical protein